MQNRLAWGLWLALCRSTALPPRCPARSCGQPIHLYQHPPGGSRDRLETLEKLKQIHPVLDGATDFREI